MMTFKIYTIYILASLGLKHYFKHFQGAEFWDIIQTGHNLFGNSRNQVGSTFEQVMSFEKCSHIFNK